MSGVFAVRGSAGLVFSCLLFFSIKSRYYNYNDNGKENGDESVRGANRQTSMSGVFAVRGSAQLVFSCLLRSEEHTSELQSP